MAVAYEENLYYFGQIVKKLKQKVWVKFLTESSEGVFSWPEKEDKDLVAPEFIFYRNLEVTADTENKTYRIKDLKEIQSKFQGFYRNHFLVHWYKKGQVEKQKPLWTL